MAERLDIPDIRAALAQRLYPTVTVWNRLEGRPRSADFSRSLRAEVRDALWMLSRQWQLGEFAGDDAGSPVSTKLHVATSELRGYRPGAAEAGPFPENLPLDAVVERRRIPLSVGGAPLALDLRLAMGRRWLALVEPIGNYADAFRRQYGVEPPDPQDPADAAICAHPTAWAAVAAVAGRALDGGALYEHLASGSSNHAYDGVVGIDPNDHDALDQAADAFMAWFDDLILQPSADDAWQPDRLEYRFACSAPVAGGAEVLGADAFEGGPLDWHAVDVDPGADVPASGGGDPPEADVLQAGVPVPVTYSGMPDARYWAFEDGQTNFGDVSASTTDLATLLFCEFALVYGNDWFLLPCDLPLGSLAHVRGLRVTTVFGEAFWIEPAGSGADQGWQQRFSLFTFDRTDGTGPSADGGLVLLPTAPTVLQGDPLEQVALIRDEMANMVWGVERVVTLADGSGVRGVEAARETLAAYQRLLAGNAPATATPPSAPIRYQAMTSVPENWIPFVPAHVEGDVRETQLQRGGDAAHPGRRSEPSRARAPADQPAAAGTRCDAAGVVLRARGGGTARRATRRAGVPARALARRARRRVVRGAARCRTRRGVERARVRSAGGFVGVLERLTRESYFSPEVDAPIVVCNVRASNGGRATRSAARGSSPRR